MNFENKIDLKRPVSTKPVKNNLLAKYFLSHKHSCFLKGIFKLKEAAKHRRCYS